MKLRKKGAYDQYVRTQKTSLLAETMQRVWENPGARAVSYTQLTLPTIA